MWIQVAHLVRGIAAVKQGASKVLQVDSGLLVQAGVTVVGDTGAWMGANKHSASQLELGAAGVGQETVSEAGLLRLNPGTTVRSWIC